MNSVAIGSVRLPGSRRRCQKDFVQQVAELRRGGESEAQISNGDNVIRSSRRCHRFPNVHREQGAQNATPYPHGRNGIEVDDGCFQQVVYVRDLCRFGGLAHRQSSPLVAEANLTYFAIDVDSRSVVTLAWVGVSERGPHQAPEPQSFPSGDFFPLGRFCFKGRPNQRGNKRAVTRHSQGFLSNFKSNGKDFEDD
jgi:hypothetical protein